MGLLCTYQVGQRTVELFELTNGHIQWVCNCEDYAASAGSAQGAWCKHVAKASAIRSIERLTGARVVARSRAPAPPQVTPAPCAELPSGQAADPLALSTMSETIFGRIIAGSIPCHKVYEDAQVLAFLDIAPLSRGHTLVVPKEPAATLDQLSDEAAAALGRVLPRICRAVMAVTGVREYNVLENNGTGAHQVVPHVHFHIIPKPDGVAGLGIGWPAGQLGADAAQLASQLARRAALP